MSHRVPGEALSRRLNARGHRRPQLGFEPSFYARRGLEDPWLNLADVNWQWADPFTVDDGWSYLSDRAYQQHLARLGFQRWSRQDRYAQWFSGHAERMLGAVERRAGPRSKGRTPFSTFGTPSLSHLEPFAQTETEPVQDEVKQTRRIRPLGRPTPGVRFPWGKPKDSSASPVMPPVKAARAPELNERAGSWVRSMEPQRRSRRNRSRPLDKVTARLVVQEAPEILAAVGLHPSGRFDSARIDRQSPRPNQSRSRRLRQVKRQLGPIARMIEPEMEKTQADDMVRPTSVAHSRIGTTVSRKRGLRPIMHRSPTMMALDPVAVSEPGEAVLDPQMSQAAPRPTADIHRRLPVDSRPQRRLMSSPVARSVKERMTRRMQKLPEQAAAMKATPSPSIRKLSRSALGTPQSTLVALTPPGPVSEQSHATAPFRSRGTMPASNVATPGVSSGSNSADATVHALLRGDATQHHRTGSLLPRVAARSLQEPKLSASLKRDGMAASIASESSHRSLPARGWRVSKFRAMAPEQTPVQSTQTNTIETVDSPAPISGVERRVRRNIQEAERPSVQQGAAADTRTTSLKKSSVATPSERRVAAKHALARIAPDAPLAGESVGRQSRRRSLLPTVSPSVLRADTEEPLEAGWSVNEVGAGRATDNDSTRTEISDIRRANSPLTTNTVAVAQAKNSNGAQRSPRLTASSPMQRAAERVDSSKGSQEPLGARDVIERLLTGRSTPSPVGYVRLAPAAHGPSRVRGSNTTTNASTRTAPLPTMLSPVAADEILEEANFNTEETSSGTDELSRNRGSRPTEWADARIPPSASAEAQLRRVLSAVNVFDTPLEALLQSSDLARVAAQMSGADLQGQLGPTPRTQSEAGTRVGRFVARTADGRFIGTAWKREKSASMSARAPIDTVLRPDTDVGVADDVMERSSESSNWGVQHSVERSNMNGQFLEAQGASIHKRDAVSATGIEGRHGSPTQSNASRWRRVRSGYGATLSAVQDGQSGSLLPTWARRASGEPLVHDMAEPVVKTSSQGELIQSLARASSPEEVIRLMADRGTTAPSTQASLSAPVLKVIEQIRTEANRVDEAQEAGATQGRRGSQSGRGQKPRSTTRVVRGFTSLSPRARTSQGTSSDQISKLARRLQALITAAEGTGAGRSAARRQVRMAEDSAAARAEGQAAADKGGKTRESQADIDALQREVLSAVTRELEMRRERRMEGGDERDWWW